MQQLTLYTLDRNRTNIEKLDIGKPMQCSRVRTFYNFFRLGSAILEGEMAGVRQKKYILEW